ncbi:TnsA-like heteromeric transposase endonuclease subunit [Streptomyces olivaceus]|uniref:TnsA-like heteromeric transposase endonuclease subunit n=1 Tax=Streptomyces olivaceus TaxID=47716 RepID=UPI001CCA2436|nr:TnsA-like heteromeric transposase endonuclease subunit [Streptomyces olivaceus]
MIRSVAMPPPSAAGAEPPVARRLADPAHVAARFVDRAGVEQEGAWLETAGQCRLEDCLPVRLFPALKGRRVAPGWFWSATNGHLVHYGSRAMRTQLMLLDHDPRVVALACRPVELLWRGRRGRLVAHAPHLMARLADGSGLLLDCVGRTGAGLRLVRRAMHVEAAAAAAGWHYRLVGPPPQVVEANVRWLAGYRHPRCAGSWLPAVAECFSLPRPLIEGVRLLGGALTVWPAVLHALWTGLLSASLHEALSERAVAVTAQTGAGR